MAMLKVLTFLDIKRYLFGGPYCILLDKILSPRYSLPATCSMSMDSIQHDIMDVICQICHVALQDGLIYPSHLILMVHQKT